MMLERASRTFICSVLFLDIVEYSRKPVAEQIRLKDRFNNLISSAIHDIPAADRIILDTGDGVAISFLGDPEDALFVAMSLRDAFAPNRGLPPEVPARIGINLGPVRLVRDLNGRPNIIGDGINVAQRVMGFAATGQILVSRSYFEIVSHISEGYTKLFNYEGSRTDKHVREHEIYSVGNSTPPARIKSAPETAHQAVNDNVARSVANNAITARLLFQVEKWLTNRSLAYGTAAFSALAFLLALLTSFIGGNPQAQQPQNARAPDAEAAGAALRPERTAAIGTTPATASPSRTQEPALHTHTTADEHQKIEGPSTLTTSKAQSKIPTVTNGVTGDDKLTAAWKSTPHRQPATAGRRALVTLAISPWGKVYVDGKLVGVSPPLKEIELAPGRRVIEIRNGDFAPFRQPLNLRSRQKIKIRHKFN